MTQAVSDELDAGSAGQQYHLPLAMVTITAIEVSSPRLSVTSALPIRYYYLVNTMSLFLIFGHLRIELMSKFQKVFCDSPQ